MKGKAARTTKRKVRGYRLASQSIIHLEVHPNLVRDIRQSARSKIIEWSSFERYTKDIRDLQCGRVRSRGLLDQGRNGHPTSHTLIQ